MTKENTRSQHVGHTAGPCITLRRSKSCPISIQVQVEGLAKVGAYLMRQGQRELDLVRHGVCVASPLQRCANSCRARSESCPSYTKRVHDVPVSSDGSIEGTSIISGTSASQLGEVGSKLRQAKSRALSSREIEVV